MGVIHKGEEAIIKGLVTHNLVVQCESSGIAEREPNLVQSISRDSYDDTDVPR